MIILEDMSKFSDSECWTKYVNDLKTFAISYGEQNHTLTLKFFNTSYSDSSKVFTYYEIETSDTNIKSTEHVFHAIDKDCIHHDKKTNTLSIGEINAYNEVTQMLLNSIMLSDDILQTKCGNVDVICYRSKLVKMLNDLWD